MDRKEYLRNYQRNWVAKRRAKFFEDKLCLKCGGQYKLELHHRNRNEKVTHKIWSWSKERQLVEIAKCDILCDSCHQLQTNKQFNFKNYKHGTNTCYTEMPCRCQLCRNAVAADRRRQRAARLLNFGK